MKLTSARTATTTITTTTFYWYNANLSYKNLVNAAQHKNKPQRNSYFYAQIKKQICIWVSLCVCVSVKKLPSVSSRNNNNMKWTYKCYRFMFCFVSVFLLPSPPPPSHDRSLTSHCDFWTAPVRQQQKAFLVVALVVVVVVLVAYVSVYVNLILVSNVLLFRAFFMRCTLPALL